MKKLAPPNAFDPHVNPAQGSQVANETNPWRFCKSLITGGACLLLFAQNLIAQSPPEPDILVKHEPVLLTAYMGNTLVDTSVVKWNDPNASDDEKKKRTDPQQRGPNYNSQHATIEVPEPFESRYHFGSPRSENGFDMDPEQSPFQFGAFTVVNWNNTDSDDKIDCDDNLINSIHAGSNPPGIPTSMLNRQEVDLFKVVIEFPTTWNRFSIGSLGFGPDSSHGLKAYTDKSKSTEYTKRTFLGSEHNVGEQITIWIEVTTPSVFSGDRSITFTHDPLPMIGAYKEEDSIDVTGIWATLTRCRSETSYYKITQTMSANTFVLSPPAGQSSVDIEVDDWIAFFDDCKPPNQPVWDTANHSDYARVTQVTLNASNLTIVVDKNMPNIYGDGDNVGMALSPGVDSDELTATFDREVGNNLGSSRLAPVSRWGIEFTFVALPVDITRKPLSHGQYAHFDVTRQTVGRSAVYRKEKWVRAKNFEDFQWPIEDELPNDEGSWSLQAADRSEINLDEDCIPGLVGLGDTFDPLYSIDAPGYKEFDLNTTANLLRLNAFEFVRVSIQDSNGQDVYIPMADIFGSRCSSKTRWRVDQNFLKNTALGPRVGGLNYMKKNAPPYPLKGGLLSNVIRCGEHMDDDDVVSLPDNQPPLLPKPIWFQAINGCNCGGGSNNGGGSNSGGPSNGS